MRITPSTTVANGKSTVAARSAIASPRYRDGIFQSLFNIGSVGIGDIEDRFLVAGNEEGRDAGEVAHFQLRVERLERLHRAGMVAAAFDQDIHVLGGARPAGPLADGVGPGQ